MAEENQTQQSEQLEVKNEQKTTPEASEYSSSERFIAAVGYISFLCLLPLILRRDSEYCQFHGKQGLFFCILFFALRFFFLLPYIGIALTIFEIIVILFMAIMTRKGKTVRAPLFADWADKLALTDEEEKALKDNVKNT